MCRDAGAYRVGGEGTPCGMVRHKLILRVHLLNHLPGAEHVNHHVLLYPRELADILDVLVYLLVADGMREVEARINDALDDGMDRNHDLLLRLLGANPDEAVNDMVLVEPAEVAHTESGVAADEEEVAADDAAPALLLRGVDVDVSVTLAKGLRGEVHGGDGVNLLTGEIDGVRRAAYGVEVPVPCCRAGMQSVHVPGLGIYLLYNLDRGAEIRVLVAEGVEIPLEVGVEGHPDILEGERPPPCCLVFPYLRQDGAVGLHGAFSAQLGVAWYVYVLKVAAEQRLALPPSRGYEAVDVLSELRACRHYALGREMPDSLLRVTFVQGDACIDDAAVIVRGDAGAALLRVPHLGRHADADALAVLHTSEGHEHNDCRGPAVLVLYREGYHIICPLPVSSQSALMR